MAVISLQALTRHQYHLNIKTIPKPAPQFKINSHTPEIELITVVTNSPISINKRVTIRLIKTSFLFNKLTMKKYPEPNQNLDFAVLEENILKNLLLMITLLST